MERWTFESQQTDRPAAGRPDNLHRPVGDDGGERGATWHGHTRGSSLYTSALLHPERAIMLVGAVALALGAATRARAAGRGRRRAP
jgi:hypothetical protein